MRINIVSDPRNAYSWATCELCGDDIEIHEWIDIAINASNDIVMVACDRM